MVHSFFHRIPFINEEIKMKEIDKGYDRKLM
jgi:hypothetical protein